HFHHTFLPIERFHLHPAGEEKDSLSANWYIRKCNNFLSRNRYFLAECRSTLEMYILRPARNYPPNLIESKHMKTGVHLMLDCTNGTCQFHCFVSPSQMNRSDSSLLKETNRSC